MSRGEQGMTEPRKLTMVQAINLALMQEMERDDDVLVLGEDIGVDGGVFRVTDGLLAKFGEQRVIDTPLAEGAIVGMAIGMALYGLKPVPEIQFSGFSFQAFHQIENHAARYRARTRGRYHVQMVVRMPYGGGVRALEHHSESEEAYYAHTPGLKIVIPSSPRSARALLVSAIRDPDTVIFFEPKALYHAVKEEVPVGEETWPIGKARVAREGKDLTLVAYGAMLHRCLDVAERVHAEDGAEVEVVDLLSISPMDTETIALSARKTGRVVVAHEAQRSFGVGAEVMARVVETAFLQLEAPVRRVTAFDIVYPGFARERGWLPGPDRVLRAVRETLAF
jgi:pyruvate dehydrogenase E1 component beta subunit